MSIALQADSSLPQGYILVNGTAAATVRQNGSIAVPSLSAITVTGTIVGNLSGTSSAIANGAVSTTAKLADGVVTTAKLGTNEQKQIAKAWVNFAGSLINLTPSNATSQNLSISAGSVTGTWFNSGSWPAEYQGVIFTIPSIGGVAGATFGGINCSNLSTGIQIISATGTTATFRMLGGPATVSQNIIGNGTSSGWTFIQTGIRSFYNISGVTRAGSGDYTVSFATPMTDPYPAILVSGDQAYSSANMFSPYVMNRTSTGFRILYVGYNGATNPNQLESTSVYASVFSN